MQRRPVRWAYVALAGWSVFTVSLTIWWVYFGVTELTRLNELNQAGTPDVIRYQKMLLWEGAFLLLFLLGGASTMGYLMWRERRERRRIQEFFASFTHELKTPLASLILQAEVLGESLETTHGKAEVQRFITDASRLNLQLENSLALAERGGALFLEPLSVGELVEESAPQVPQVAVRVEGQGSVLADRRAMASIFGNLFQNSHRHGAATTILVRIADADRDRVRIEVSDNGSGFNGVRDRLGKLFTRHYHGSGSGTGLHLVRELSKRLGGVARFLDRSPGFHVEILLPRGGG